MTGFLILVRFLHEAGLMVLFGSGCLFALLAAKVPELAWENNALIFSRRLASLTALLGAPVWFVLASGNTDVFPGLKTFDAPEVLPLLLLAVRLLLLLVLVWATWRSRNRTMAQLAGAVLVLIAVTSHTAAASPNGFRPFGIASDALHLLTAGYWIGSLPVLWMLLAQRPAAPRLGLAITVFSQWGLIAVALLLMSGMINAAMVLLGTPGHDATAYLAVLGTKLVLVAAMVGLAVVNQYRLLPGLEDPMLEDRGTAPRLKKHVAWELGLGLLVVALAMALDVLAPTHS